MEIIITISTVVAEPFAIAVAGVAVEPAAGVGGDREESQIAAGMGRVGDQLR